MIWSVANWLLVIWKPWLSDKIHNIFQVIIVSILLYGCTTWTLFKSTDKKLDSKCTKILWPILNKCWKQNSTKQQLYGHLPLIFKTIQIRQTRFAVHCRRNKKELISDVLLWTPSQGRAGVGRTDIIYLLQLCMSSSCILEDLPNVMDDRDD